MIKAECFYKNDSYEEALGLFDKIIDLDSTKEKYIIREDIVGLK
jgi:hypothetical protein